MLSLKPPVMIATVLKRHRLSTVRRVAITAIRTVDELLSAAGTDHFGDQSMRKLFSNLRQDDRGDQVVGWVILAALVAIVGGFLWMPTGDCDSDPGEQDRCGPPMVNIGEDLNAIMGGVEGVGGIEGATQVNPNRLLGIE